MKKVAVLQSNYIPWKGYFEIINDVDEFIIYDDVQFTKNDWRNRNIILSKTGKQWLTIPVKHKSLKQKVNEVEISNKNWNRKHWSSIITNYGKAPFFSEISRIFKPIYENIDYKFISEINFLFIKEICKVLNIETNVTHSTEYIYDTKSKKQERLMGLLLASNATDYLSGPSAEKYINSNLFDTYGIRLHWKSYGPYLDYRQLHSKESFISKVSIIDLLFNTGIEHCHKYIISNDKSNISS